MCSVFVLERLSDDDIKEIITRAVARISPEAAENTNSPSHDVEELTEIINAESSSQPLPSQASSSTVAPTQLTSPFPASPHITSQVLSSLVSLSAGDARTALSLLSLAMSSSPLIPTSELLESLRKSVIAGYDRTGDSHYDLISALHKSVRGSNGSAALYWLARMLRGGEDPLYVARRMVVCASEDIGLADPQALPLVCSSNLGISLAVKDDAYSLCYRLWRRTRPAKSSVCLSVELISHISFHISLRRQNRLGRIWATHVRRRLLREI